MAHAGVSGIQETKISSGDRSPIAEDQPPAIVSPEDGSRAQVYRLLAGFLSAPPDAERLSIGAGLEGDASELGAAVSRFAQACAGLDPARVEEEYHDLFIGVGRGELVPYGSYYLTGFLHEKPLAKLRAEMARLGLAREADKHEPEDHIASVLEIMAGLIDGQFGEPAPLSEQKHFFETHVGSWAPYFFRDLESARSSVLYATLARVGRIFLDIEETAFRMS